ncbi:MAG TPA: cytochrome C oxidase subunit IV family protein [Humisphaera sp.]
MAHPAAVSRLGEGDAEGGAPRGHTEPAHEHHVPYYAIFAALIVLTLVTVAVATKRFESEWTNVGIALAVASVKATLVARYFMHLKFEGRLVKLALYFPLLLCVIMIAALIPDVAMGRKTAFNDTLQPYDQPEHHEHQK